MTQWTLDLVEPLSVAIRSFHQLLRVFVNTQTGVYSWLLSGPRSVMGRFAGGAALRGAGQCAGRDARHVDDRETLGWTALGSPAQLYYHFLFTAYTF